MMADNDQGLSFIGISLPEEGEYRGLKELFAAGGVAATFKTGAGELASGFKQFVGQIDAALQEVETTMHGFELERLEVSATLAADGKLLLVALEGELGISGGLKFIFARRGSE